MLRTDAHIEISQCLWKSMRSNYVLCIFFIRQIENTKLNVILRLCKTIFSKPF